MTNTSEISTAERTVKLRYFAWVRERVGLAEEDVELPSGLATVSELYAWLAARGPEFAAVFGGPSVVRAAIDHHHARAGASLSGAREIALFPPVTGG